MWMWNFLFSPNRVFKHKEVVSSLHVCCNGLGKMWGTYIFHFFITILTSTHKKNLIIFCIIYDAMSNIHFSVLDYVKMTSQHINTKVFFKITIRKRHVNIEIRWPWKCNHYFYLGFWNDERTKIIFLPSFQFVTRLNSQNRYEKSLLMNSGTLICIWILVIPIGIIQVSTPRKWSFLLYFNSLHYYWTPSTLIQLVHNSLGEMVRCKKRAIQLLKMRKMKIRRNIKNKCVTDFL